jgi:hypothetical protein
MSQATLERDIAPETDENAHGSFARTALRVVLLSVVVTALIAGLYAMFGGNGSDPLAATPASGSGKTVATGTKAAPAAPAKPAPTYAELAAQRAAKLPSASGTNREKLIGYLAKMDIKITAASSPATAATTACSLLNSGTSPKSLINGVSNGGQYTKEQSKAFLLGATTLYCPTQAKNFR